MKLYSLLFLTLGLLSAPLDIHSASKKKSVSKKKYTKKKVAKKVTLNDEQIAAAAAAQRASERARAEVAKRTPSKKKKGSSPAPVAKKGKKKAAPAKKTKKKSRPDASAEEQAQRERERLEQEQAEERARMEQERRDRELAQQLAQEEAHKAQEALHAAKHADAAEHARLAQEAQAAQAEVERLEQERQAAERAAEELRLKQQEELARKVDEDLERERQSIARAELKRKERERKRREQEQQEQQELARQQVQGLSEELRQQQEQQREQERANREREEARKKAQLQADAQAAAEAARRGGEEERRAATAAAREKEEQGRFLIHFRNPVGLELQVDPNPSSFASQTLESTVANVILHTIPDFIAAGNHHFTNAQGADLAGETTVGALASNPDGLVPRESKSGKRVIHVSLAAGAGEKHGAAGEAKKKKESWTLVFRNIVGREFVVNNSGGGEGGRTLNEVITSYLGFGPDFIDDGNRHFANARGDALAGNVSIDTLIGMDINKNFPQSAQGKRVINVSLAAGADGKHAAAGVGESKEAASAVSRQEQIDKEAASLRHAIDTNDEDALRAL
ncbi:MAG TPA: hypothetical protein VLG71_00585, partial [Candidatus Limnocylindria bacterium]|nr:hypothetical protein [Candidatus Limnocylindria bacterium]